jgi:lipopolysaccharide export system protein LptA
VKRGGDEVAGNYIMLDQRSDFFSVSTGKDKDGKEQAPSGRVKAVIQPKPRPPEAK